MYAQACKNRQNKPSKKRSTAHNFIRLSRGPNLYSFITRCDVVATWSREAEYVFLLLCRIVHTSNKNLTLRFDRAEFLHSGTTTMTTTLISFRFVSFLSFPYLIKDEDENGGHGAEKLPARSLEDVKDNASGPTGVGGLIILINC
jgi:hypothetical protein